MPTYNLFYTLRGDEDMDFKADIYAEKPTDKEGVKDLSFEAADDGEAKKKVYSLIEPKDGRSVRGIGQLKNCRPKGKSGAVKPAVAIDLNAFNEPLRGRIFDALTPLIEDGTLIEENLKLRPKDRGMLVVRKRTRKKPAPNVIPDREPDKQEAEQPQAQTA